MKNENRIKIGRDVHGDVNVQSTVTNTGALSSTQAIAVRDSIERILGHLEEAGVRGQEFSEVQEVLGELSSAASNETLSQSRAKQILNAATQCANGVAAGVIATELATHLPFLA